MTAIIIEEIDITAGKIRHFDCSVRGIDCFGEVEVGGIWFVSRRECGHEIELTASEEVAINRFLDVCGTSDAGGWADYLAAFKDKSRWARLEAEVAAKLDALLADPESGVIDGRGFPGDAWEAAWPARKEAELGRCWRDIIDAKIARDRDQGRRWRRAPARPSLFDMVFESWARSDFLTGADWMSLIEVADTDRALTREQGERLKAPAISQWDAAFLMLDAMIARYGLPAWAEPDMSDAEIEAQAEIFRTT